MRIDPSRLPDDDKFRELVLFICQRSEGDPQFGATKLNKLLFYSDFLAFRKLGKAITWHRYQRLPQGPAPRALLPLLADMEAAGDIARGERNYFGRVQKRTFALRDARLEEFTADEIALVSELIRDCWGKNATEISLMSHRFRGWKMAEDGEDIPYETVLVQFQRPRDTDRARGDAIADELLSLAKECPLGDDR
ncbi:MAG: Panacea domain-containing protein [Pirellulales bacterium]